MRLLVSVQDSCFQKRSISSCSLPPAGQPNAIMAADPFYWIRDVQVNEARERQPRPSTHSHLLTIRAFRSFQKHL